MSERLITMIRAAEKSRFPVELPGSSLDRTAALSDAIASVLNQPIILLERIHGGRSSTGFRVCTSRGDFYAKCLWRDRELCIDGLALEFAVSGDLWSRNVRCIPQPIEFDTHRGIAIYRYIDGIPVSAGSADEHTIDSLAAFLLAFSRLRSVEERQQGQSPADLAEGCRFAIETLNPAGDIPAMHFLVRQLAELERCITTRFGDICQAAENDMHPAIFVPGTAGLQHLMIAKDRSLWMTGFEGSGFDDPLHLIAESLVNPWYGIPRRYHRRFLDALIPMIPGSLHTRRRFAAFYGLCEVKACASWIQGYRVSQSLPIPRHWEFSSRRARHLIGKIQSMVADIRRDFETDYALQLFPAG